MATNVATYVLCGTYVMRGQLEFEFLLLQGGTITTIHFHEIERRGVRVTRSRIQNKQGIAQFKACHARMPISA